MMMILQYRIDTIVLADYTIEALVEKDLYILIPFYLFNHEKDIEKYNTDKTCRKRVRKAMYKMVQAINKGLAKQNTAIGKELDEIMSEGVLRIPGEKYYLNGINDTKRNTALNMLADGKLSVNDIAKYSGLSKEEVKKLKHSHHDKREFRHCRNSACYS